MKNGFSYVEPVDYLPEDALRATGLWEDPPKKTTEEKKDHSLKNDKDQK